MKEIPLDRHSLKVHVWIHTSFSWRYRRIMANGFLALEWEVSKSKLDAVLGNGETMTDDLK
ncbi:MAG: hypothetical protein ACLPPF_04555, partial [Rhodomicrobium sp.]